MDTEIILVLAASLFVFCLLLFLFNFVLRYQRKTLSFLKEKELMEARFEQTLLQSQIEVQESTSSLLSRELHDNVGQLLSTAKMLLGITERNTVNPPDTLLTANETVGAAIKELRSLSKSLSREWLEQFDFINNLKTEMNRIHSAGAIRIHLLHPDKLFLQADRQIIFFRIVQEAIQNAIKHSDAKNIYISLSQSHDLLTTEIKDDGKGFILSQHLNGVGILNMKNRAKLLGGNIEWKSSEEGSVVHIALPVNTDE